MRKSSFKFSGYIPLIFVSFRTVAQQLPVPLIESSFTVKNNRSETYYFGLAKGDVLNFSVDVTDAAIREVEFGAYPSTVIFSQNYVGNIENKSVSITHTGVYYFRFYQSGFLAGRRHCGLKADRIPVSKDNIAFNTTVYWRDKTDTVWYYEDEKYITRTDTIVTVAADQKVLLKRRGNGRMGLVLFSLPDTYDYMALWFGTGKKAAEQFSQTEKHLALSSPPVEKYGLMADIALRGSASFIVQGGCLPASYWLLDNKNDIINPVKYEAPGCMIFYTYEGWVMPALDGALLNCDCLPLAGLNNSRQASTCGVEIHTRRDSSLRSE